MPLLSEPGAGEAFFDVSNYVKEYSDPLTRYAKVDTTNNTFTVTWAL